jgi:hypothetical protein
LFDETDVSFAWATGDCDAFPDEMANWTGGLWSVWVSEIWDLRPWFTNCLEGENCNGGGVGGGRADWFDKSEGFVDVKQFKNISIATGDFNYAVTLA